MIVVVRVVAAAPAPHARLWRVWLCGGNLGARARSRLRLSPRARAPKKANNNY